MKFTVQTRGQLTVSQKSKKTYFMVEGFAEGGETQKCICFNPTQYEDFASGNNPDVDIKPRQSGDPSIELAKEGETEPTALSTQAKPEPLPEPAPQAVGMMTKEIGDMIRAKYLVSIFGTETRNELIKWYRGQVLGITRIPYDGTKLPTFEKGD